MELRGEIDILKSQLAELREYTTTIQNKVVTSHQEVANDGATSSSFFTKAHGTVNDVGFTTLEYGPGGSPEHNTYGVVSSTTIVVPTQEEVAEQDSKLTQEQLVQVTSIRSSMVSVQQKIQKHGVYLYKQF